MTDGSSATVNPTPTLATPRLTLRAITRSDTADIVRLAGVPEVSRFLSNLPYPLPAPYVREWIDANARIATEGGGFGWAITDRESGSVMGTITIAFDLADSTGYLGYWIGTVYWNHGYATEALRPVIELGFLTHGMQRIKATVLPGNDASCRVLEKLGFQTEGLLPESVLKNGILEDRLLFGLPRDVWEASGGR